MTAQLPAARDLDDARISRTRRTLARTLRFAILRRDRFTCCYCGRHAPDVALEVDHRLPLAFGGTDHPSNLVTACADCNGGKRAMAETPDGAVIPERANRSELPYGLPSIFRVTGTDEDGCPADRHVHWQAMTAQDWHQVAGQLRAKECLLALQRTYIQTLAQHVDEAI